MEITARSCGLQLVLRPLLVWRKMESLVAINIRAGWDHVSEMTGSAQGSQAQLRFLDLATVAWCVGPDHSVLRVGQDVSCVPGLRPLGVRSKPLPSRDNQKWLQTSPSAPGGGGQVKLPQVDVILMHRYFMDGVHKVTVNPMTLQRRGRLGELLD